MTVFLGTLWSSNKQIKAPYVFDWEHGIAMQAMKGNRASSRSEGEVSWFFSTCGGHQVYILELSVFNKSQASSPFEALNSACLSKGQRDVRPHVKMRRGPRAFPRVSTGDSDIPSSCDMKDQPALKPLQVNPAFFRVRASRCPFH